jgi:hypothetical protein
MRLTPDQQAIIHATVADTFGGIDRLSNTPSLPTHFHHCQANRHPFMTNDIGLLRLQNLDQFIMPRNSMAD